MSATDRRRSSSMLSMPWRRINRVTFACSTASAVGIQAYSLILFSVALMRVLAAMLTIVSAQGNCDSVHRGAAVDSEDLAGDEACLLGCEVRDRGGHLGQRRGAAHRNDPQEGLSGGWVLLEDGLEPGRRRRT